MPEIYGVAPFKRFIGDQLSLVIKAYTRVGGKNSSEYRNRN